MGKLQPENFPLELSGYFGFFPPCNINNLFRLLTNKSQAMYVDNNFYTSHVLVRTVHTYSDALHKLHAEFHHGLQEFRNVERTIDP